MEKKKCSKCGKKKFLNKFYKNKWSKNGYHHYCKECHSENSKLKYASDLEFRKKRKDYRLKYKYNLDSDNVNNIREGQNNKCCICNNPFHSERTIFIDHNHKNGNVRGLLCPKCNNILGNCNDDINILKSAITYLEMRN